jgi:hypothetical protein
MKRVRNQGPARLLLLAALLTIAVAMGACVVPAPATPAATTAPTEVAPATSAPTQAPAASAEPAGPAKGNVGVDAEGHFYRGDPNAAVKLIEFSDFQ